MDIKKQYPKIDTKTRYNTSKTMPRGANIEAAKAKYAWKQLKAANASESEIKAAKTKYETLKKNKSTTNEQSPAAPTKAPAPAPTKPTPAPALTKPTPASTSPKTKAPKATKPTKTTKTTKTVKPIPLPITDTRPVCRQFLEGRCVRGKCKFRHPEGASGTVEKTIAKNCRQYMDGNCTRGDRCKFTHDPSVFPDGAFKKDTVSIQSDAGAMLL